MDRKEHQNEGWSLQLEDLNFITSKKQSAWLDYSIKLLSYKRSGVFAKYTEVDLPTLEYIADQLLLPENLVRRGNSNIHVKIGQILEHTKHI